MNRVECFNSHVARVEAVLAWRGAARYATSASCLRADTLLRDAVTASPYPTGAVQGAAADSLPGPDYECGMPPLRGGSAPCVSERRVGLVSSVTSRRWDLYPWQGHRPGPAVPGP